MTITLKNGPYVPSLGDATLIFEIELFEFHGEDVTKGKVMTRLVDNSLQFSLFSYRPRRGEEDKVQWRGLGPTQ